jgi:hypothetical protein
MVCPVSGYVESIAAWSSLPPGGAETFNYRERIGNVNQSPAVIISGAGQSVVDATRSNFITAGSLISIRLITSAAAAVADHNVIIAIRVTDATLLARPGPRNDK